MKKVASFGLKKFEGGTYVINNVRNAQGRSARADKYVAPVLGFEGFLKVLRAQLPGERGSEAQGLAEDALGIRARLVCSLGFKVS